MPFPCAAVTNFSQPKHTALGAFNLKWQRSQGVAQKGFLPTVCVHTSVCINIYIFIGISLVFINTGSIDSQVLERAFNANVTCAAL